MAVKVSLPSRSRQSSLHPSIEVANSARREPKTNFGGATVEGRFGILRCRRWISRSMASGWTLDTMAGLGFKVIGDWVVRKQEDARYE